MKWSTLENRLILSFKANEKKLRHSKLLELVTPIAKALALTTLIFSFLLFLGHLVGILIASLVIVFLLKHFFGIEDIFISPDVFARAAKFT